MDWSICFDKYALASAMIEGQLEYGVAMRHKVCQHQRARALTHVLLPLSVPRTFAWRLRATPQTPTAVPGLL